MKKIFISYIVVISMVSAVAQPSAPDNIYGQLFKDVQLQKVFSDSKTFADCTAKRKITDILRDYKAQKQNTDFDLKKFVAENFDLSKDLPALNYIQQEKDIVAHINNLWSMLTRKPDVKQEGSSLLPLPYSYVVPGGRFKEMYYWDSYFTMLGLKESKQYVLLENMVKNFAYLIDTYGHIPNGTRTYYLGRSQPPFFSLMIDLLASLKGDIVYKTYLPQLQKEYDYFMQGASKLNNGEAYRYVVKTKDGAVLNRYWDDMDVPRQESYAEDVATADKACNDVAMKSKWSSAEAKEKALDALRKKTYKNLRAAACSGLDFSNKWFADGEHIETIHTTDFIAADLNGLLLHLEEVLSKAYRLKNNFAKRDLYQSKSVARNMALMNYCWNDEVNFFTDYDFIANVKSQAITPMGMFPFCFINLKNSVNRTRLNKAAEVLQSKLLKDGGLQCTETNAHQQWDAPNGWAPMQWMSIIALERGNQKELAKTIAQRWIKINKKVYLNTGKLMEKYNVVDTDLMDGGGEYPSQDGFGWTNGVLVALIKKYDNK
ncbi:MAG: alpha,alpha-trehalase TreF [Bacteroidetes bacterium]|nr:alpha,alpha-trehalase TreF [Bacteroidota bacterium]